MQTRQVILVARPQGMPTTDIFRLTKTTLPGPGSGQVLVRTAYLSVDPYMRGRMRDAKSYTAPYALNEVIAGGGVGEVVESRYPGISAGDWVVGTFGWQDYNVLEGRTVRVLDPLLAPVTTALGVLGMPGLTAYFGLTRVAGVIAGETVVVSGAAGAVGMTAVQIAKNLGARVVGIAGSDEKTAFLLRELGADHAINYRAVDDLSWALAEACPSGVDVYFDNVGGPVTFAVLDHLAVRARVAVCGQISRYNEDQPGTMPDIMWSLIARRLRIEGFLVGDFAAESESALAELTDWYRAGRLKSRDTIIEGLENLPRAFIGLFRGENLGKQLVKVGAGPGAA